MEEGKSLAPESAGLNVPKAGMDRPTTKGVSNTNLYSVYNLTLKCRVLGDISLRAIILALTSPLS